MCQIIVCYILDITDIHSRHSGFWYSPILQLFTFLQQVILSARRGLPTSFLGQHLHSQLRHFTFSWTALILSKHRWFMGQSEMPQGSDRGVPLWIFSSGFSPLFQHSFISAFFFLGSPGKRDCIFAGALLLPVCAPWGCTELLAKALEMGSDLLTPCLASWKRLPCRICLLLSTRQCLPAAALFLLSSRLKAVFCRGWGSSRVLVHHTQNQKSLVILLISAMSLHPSLQVFLFVFYLNFYCHLHKKKMSILFGLFK